jgi:hypothetical protein
MGKTKFVIKREGQGGFLNPPNDAEHIYCVMEKYLNGRECGSMSLRYSLTDSDVPEEIKEKVRTLLNENKDTLTEEWEHSCYNYFRNCYSPDGIDRNVTNCLSDKTNSLPSHNHLAYLHIKSFFPNYEPNEFLIVNNGNNGSWSNSK